MLIRTLDPNEDHTRVMTFLPDAADYVCLERGAYRSPVAAYEVFRDAPPRVATQPNRRAVACSNMAV